MTRRWCDRYKEREPISDGEARSMAGWSIVAVVILAVLAAIHLAFN